MHGRAKKGVGGRVSEASGDIGGLKEKGGLPDVSGR